MPSLFVDRTIEIHVPAKIVWKVLTERPLSDQWVANFSNAVSPFHLESDWNLGSPVQWKTTDGILRVEGEVTMVEPERFLRFTVFDVTDKTSRGLFGEEDGISYELNEHEGNTTLRVRQGDFGVLEEGAKYRDWTEQTWDRCLPIIKDLAEKEALQ